MSNVLVIYSSLNNQSSQSTRLAREYLETLRGKQDVRITERDLMASELSHLTSEEMGAWMTEAGQRDETQQQLAAISDALVAEVKAADEIVVAVPMYNFGIPSQLKAWIDRIARAGITFRYTENGPQGLLENKRVTVVATRGGVYQGTEYDTQSDYLRHFFAFVGITDVRFVYAEGLNMGADVASEAIDKARQSISELVV